MLEEQDLDAAAAQGIISAEQAAGLRNFALQREKERAALHGHEERFRFMSGFNDFFLAIGVVMLGAGVIYFIPSSNTLGNVLAAAGIWALAELLVGRMRLVLPGILIACLFVLFVFRAVPVVDFLLRFPFFVPQDLTEHFASQLFGTAAASAIMLKALVSMAAAGLFYARFGLPFALLLIAGSIVIAIEAMAFQLLGTSAIIRSLVTLACGVFVFAAAMGFDLSDRERMTRRADCAFWLHLLAAPLIVHSLISMVTPSFMNLTSIIAAAIVLVVAGLTFVAIVIDRRALLVSALSYLGAVIAYAIANTAAGDKSSVFFSTLVVLGVMILALGVGWLPLRRVLVRVVPFSGLVNRLPPVVAA
jgi:hypothetical protein